MKKNYLLKTSKTFFYITSAVLIISGIGYIALKGYNLYTLLIILVGAAIMSFAILYKNYMQFNSDEILWVKGFPKSTIKKSFKYSSLKSVHIYIQIRGDSLFSFKIDENIYTKTFSYSIDHNFNGTFEIKEYLNYLHGKGISIHCKNEEYLLKTFDKEIKDIKKEKDKYKDTWYYIEGQIPS